MGARPRRTAIRKHASRSLHEALDLWRESALAEFAFEPFAQAEIRRLADLRLAALEERIDADMALGRHADLIGELEALIAGNPHRERLRGQLMLALYRSGRQAEALAAYRDARLALVDELGIEPGAELQTLEKAILIHDPTLSVKPTRQTQPALRLPSPSTPLIGRLRELAEARALLQAHRIVTLVGAGGSGKTRLALAVAAAAAEEFPDGVVWVSLQEVSDPELVLPMIAQAVEATNELAEHLERKRALLVLDNFEQVLSAASGIADLLGAAPEVKVLATSREPLHLSGEHEYPVLPLPESDAVTLFVERALAVAPDFRGGEQVAAICRRLDCRPLAIELAAARTKLLSPDALLGRLGDRLPLLTGGPRDAPARQQTLRSTIDWSHDLLDAKERILFARLAVFVGGCTLEAAENVCGADLDALESLVDKSLVLMEQDRFSMLQTIHQYALERLDKSSEAEKLRQLHAEHFVSAAERGETEAVRTDDRLQGLEFRRLRDQLTADYENVRSALAWAIARGQRELALRLAGAARHLHYQGTLVETRRTLEAALALDGEASAATEAKAHMRAAGLAADAGDYVQCTRHLEESLALSRAAGDLQSAAKTTLLLAHSVRQAGDLTRSRRLHEEALALARELSLSSSLTDALHNLGELERDEGHHKRAAELLDESLQHAERAGNLRQASRIRHGLADLRLEEGDLDHAGALYRESLAHIWLERGELNSIYPLGGLAATAAAAGEIPRAGRLWGAFERFEEARAVRMAPVERTRYQRLLSRVDQAVLADAIAHGRRMTLEEAVEYALAPD
jgi:predicted ATPase